MRIIAVAVKRETKLDMHLPGQCRIGRSENGHVYLV